METVKSPAIGILGTACERPGTPGSRVHSNDNGIKLKVLNWIMTL